MMARVLILGANGQLARNTTRVLLGDPALTLTLYLRRANRLKNPKTPGLYVRSSIGISDN
jgi:hypothetical protein